MREKGQWEKVIFSPKRVDPCPPPPNYGHQHMPGEQHIPPNLIFLKLDLFRGASTPLSSTYNICKLVPACTILTFIHFSHSEKHFKGI